MALKPNIGGRAQRWTPDNLGRDVLWNWWSPFDHGTGFMTDDGAGLISNYVDRIRSVAVTATTTARPTWSATRFGGTYPGFTFDGVANCFVTTTLTNIITGATGVEIFMVAQNLDLVTSGLVALRWGTAAAGLTGIQKNGTSSSTVLVTDGTTTRGSGTVNFDSPRIIHTRHTGTTLALSTDGSAELTATCASKNNNGTRFRIGANTAPTAASFFNGYIGDIFITRDLPDTLTRQKGQGFLAWRFGLQANLPDTHPYRWSPP